MENLSDTSFQSTHNTTITNWKDVTSFTEYKAAFFMWRVGTPFILLLGGFGNVATICVMRRTKESNSTQHAFIISLAVSDLILLYVGMPREWIRCMYYVDLMELNSPACKIYSWILYFFSSTSAWLVTCITVQRTMAVLWPHKMRAVCTLRKAWITVAVVYITAGFLHAHLLLGMEISLDKKCDAVPGVYSYFKRHIYTWIDMCAASLFPAVFLFICNIILSFTLWQSRSVTVNPVITKSTSQESDHRKTIALQTTVMVLALSCTFLVLTLPICIYAIWAQELHAQIMNSPYLLAVTELALAVTFMLWYLNSAVNFLLYCFTGTKFRREFLSWIRCSVPSDSSSSEKTAAT